MLLLIVDNHTPSRWICGLNQDSYLYVLMWY